MTFLLVLAVLLLSNAQATSNFSLSTSPSCSSLADCPSGSERCSPVQGMKRNRCIANLTDVCTGGAPILPIRSCSRQRDCSANLTRFKGWCDMETRYCCERPEDSPDPMTCPDRLTPLYGQEKCKDFNKTMIYSGKSEQRAGFCYKGYSCPPKITQSHQMSFGSMTFRTNMDCHTGVQLEKKFNFMFCHNSTGNIWVIGQLNVNGDEVIHHWNQCKINTDCGEGQVCVKEDLCRYRCYVDPTTEVDYDWIIAQILAMFLLPLIFLASIIFLTVRYLD